MNLHKCQVIPEVPSDMNMQESYHHVMAIDLVRQSHSMQCHLQSIGEIKQVFDSITYTKGPHRSIKFFQRFVHLMFTVRPVIPPLRVMTRTTK